MHQIATDGLPDAHRAALVRWAAARSYDVVECDELRRGLLIVGEDSGGKTESLERVRARPPIRTVCVATEPGDSDVADVTIHPEAGPAEVCELIARWIDEGMPGARLGPAGVSKES